jgi:predicted nucleic acid-binding protein
MTVLIDTGPVVALCDPRDAKHKTALRHLSTLASASYRTCDAVLAEACFHLPHPSQRMRLRALIEELDISSVTATRETERWLDTFDWMAMYADHEPDWADAAIAVICGRDPAIEVWTYDREFRTIWRKPDGRPIPLAIGDG